MPNSFDFDAESEPTSSGTLRSARKDLLRISLRLRFLRYRQAARRVFDGFRFGTGYAERMSAALVVGALFFLLTLGLCALGQQPVHIAICAGAVVLLIAWGTSAIFVFGSADEDVATEAETLAERAAIRRLDVRARVAEQSSRPKASVTREPRFSDDSQDSSPSSRSSRFDRCDYCDEVISSRAVKCKHCGEILDESLRRSRERSKRPTFSPILAGLLSWFIPGLGQLYKGQVGRAVLWFFIVIVGYACCLVPGPILSIVCICDAASHSD